MRIIAGQCRGRKIQCPKDVTRPTLDRVREALFSILGPLEGDTVVDFYAGSGALGLEAVSRGAARALLVESDRQAAGVIEKNVATLGLEAACSVLACKVENSRAALAMAAPIDLVLADPPWKISQSALPVVEEVVRGLLAPDGRVVVGHASREALEPAEGSGLELSSTRRWGDSALSFFVLSG